MLGGSRGFGFLYTVVLVGAIGGAPGCSSSDAANTPAKPGDQFFRSVIAGSSDTGEVSGELDIILYDSTVEGHEVGKAGAIAGSRDVEAKIFVGGQVAKVLTGSYDSKGAYQATNGDWSIKGTSDGHSTKGTATGPGGAKATIAGSNLQDGKVGAFCGTYSGDASGAWNLVVAESGGVHGAFSGDAEGSLTGNASGTNISLDWSGTAFLDSVSGSAKGTVSESAGITGTWSGTDNGQSLSGSWSSTDSCGAPSTPVAEPAGSCPGTCQQIGCCGPLCCID